MYIEEYLQDLRRDGFAPRAIVRYVRRAFARAREGMIANPGAARSIWSLGLVFFSLCFVGSTAIALWDGRRLALDFFLFTTLAMLPVFAAVTLHLDLLRDREGYRLSAVNLPTALTLLRFCLAPGIALFLAEHHYALALGIYLAAELSDVADGWLARRLKQITRLGTVLDPLVDILFNVVVFGGLFLGRVIPTWVLGVALLRYADLPLRRSVPVPVRGAGDHPAHAVRAAERRGDGGAHCLPAAAPRAARALDGPPRAAHHPRARRVAAGGGGTGRGARLVQPAAPEGPGRGPGPRGGRRALGQALSQAVLEGDLGRFQPAEVAQLLQLAQATGRLELSRPALGVPGGPGSGRGAETVDVFFVEGRPVFARTSGQSVRTGEILVHRGHATHEAVIGALEAQRRGAGKRIGEVLADRSAVAPEQVVAGGARVRAPHPLRRCCSGVRGASASSPASMHRTNDLPLDLDLDRLILEGLRLADQARAGR